MKAMGRMFCISGIYGFIASINVGNPLCQCKTPEYRLKEYFKKQKTTTTNQIGNDSLETTRKKDEYVFKAQTRESFILKLGCFKFF